MSRPILVADRIPTSNISLISWVDEIADLTRRPMWSGVMGRRGSGTG